MHTLIVGKSGEGKTTLAKKLAAGYQEKGTAVLVLTTHRYDSWPCDYLTTDPDEYMKVAFQHKNCALFIDEAGATIGKHGQERNRIATEGRHYGHQAYFICQRAQQLDPSSRTQCVNLAMFRTTYEDAKLLYSEFVDKAILEEVGTLKRYQCLMVTQSRAAYKLQV